MGGWICMTGFSATDVTSSLNMSLWARRTSRHALHRSMCYHREYPARVHHWVPVPIALLNGPFECDFAA
jgi:hypothetical protein